MTNILSKAKETLVDKNIIKSSTKNKEFPGLAGTKLLSQNIHVAAPDLSKLSKRKAQDVINSFKGGVYTKKTYGEETVLYRVGDNIGDYWTLEMPPTTKSEWIERFAILPQFNNNGTKLYRITIPKGSSITGLDGSVERQGNLPGEAHQLYLNSREIPENWIEETPMKWR